LDRAHLATGYEVTCPSCATPYSVTDLIEDDYTNRANH
jgi:hypothetical protein